MYDLLWIVIVIKCKIGISDIPAEVKQDNQGTVSFYFLR